MYVLRFFNTGEGARGKLDDYANLMGIQGKTSDGLEAVKMWTERDLKRLEEYCLQDCRITLELFNRCVKCKLIA